MVLPFWHLLIQAYYFIVSFVGGTLPGIVSTSQKEWASLVAEAEAPASVLDFADASICVQFYSKSTGHFEHSYVQTIDLERLELARLIARSVVSVKCSGGLKVTRENERI